MASRPFDLPRLEARALPGPDDIDRWELGNGLVVLVRPNHASPSVVVKGYLAAGALAEDEHSAGRAHLCAAGLMRGTRRRSFEEIYETIESLGATLGFGVGKHHTSFHGKSLAEDLPVVLELLAEVVRHPAFPADQIERLRAERLTALHIRDHDTGAVAGLRFDRLAYPDHPYAVPVDGTRESVAGLTRDTLLGFHERAYGPRGMVLAVVGAVQGDRVRDLVEERLGSWSATEQDPPAAVGAAAAPGELRRTDVVLDGKSQCDLVVGAPGPRRTSPAYLACALGNNILGRFGLYGRIGDAVRERAGLAYYAYSSLSGGPGPGPWTVLAGINPAHVEQGIELIRQEIARFVASPVTRAELEENQAHFIGRLPLQLESNEGVAGALVNLEQYDLGLDYYQTYAARVAAVRRDEVLAAARDYLSPDRLAIAVAGPPAGGTT